MRRTGSAKLFTFQDLTDVVPADAM